MSEYNRSKGITRQGTSGRFGSSSSRRSDSGSSRSRYSRDGDSGSSRDRYSRDGDSGGSRGGFNRKGRELKMHDVICDKCKKNCQVPFRPTEGKPVYCSECFRNEENGGTSTRVDNSINDYQFEKLNQKLDTQLEIIHKKLDKILERLVNKE